MLSSPTLVLRNNLPFAVRLSVMNATQPQSQFANTRQYLFNMQCQGFTGTDRVRIKTRLNGASVWTTLTAVNASTTLASAVDALNTLGIGTFYGYTTLGIPYITVFNDDREYTDLELFDSLGRDVDVIFNWSLTENTSGSVTTYINCNEAGDDTFTAPGVGNNTDNNMPFGTKYVIVIVGGDNTNPNNYINYSISSPTGPITSGSVAPGETKMLSFVVDIPQGGFAYNVDFLDSV